jgi:pyruvate/2-oxoglutarate dehydrogenase complex dihydrolipoamide dehydrogenase (E3) component
LHDRRKSPSFGQGPGRIDAEEYDLVILGGGTGSTIAAWTFAAEGKRVAVIDRKYIGGSCPNIACLPSKNIIHSAKVASHFRRGKEFGTLSETRGFLKALVEAYGDRIPGFTAFAIDAGDIMVAVQVAMIAGLPYTAFQNAVLTHPNLVEELTLLFSSPALAHNAADSAASSAA